MEWALLLVLAMIIEVLIAHVTTEGYVSGSIFTRAYWVREWMWLKEIGREQ